MGVIGATVALSVAQEHPGTNPYASSQLMGELNLYNHIRDLELENDLRALRNPDPYRAPCP